TAVRLDVADDDIGAARLAPAPFIQHRIGLADAGGHAKIDAQATAPQLMALCGGGSGLALPVGILQAGGARPRGGRARCGIAQPIAIQQLVWTRAFRLLLAITAHVCCLFAAVCRCTQTQTWAAQRACPVNDRASAGAR